MGRVLGIDAGGLGNPSWLAFLEDGRVSLAQHVFTIDALILPWLESGEVACVAIDAPQGLPRGGHKRRQADADADTPTRRLPASRAEMDAGRSGDGKGFAYVGPVRTGVALFWANRQWLFGLVQQPRLLETYPNVVFRSLTGKRPPPKRKRPYEYCVAVATLMHGRQVSCPGVDIPSVDQCDSILCAIAAQAFEDDRAEALGLPPVVDEGEMLLREGFIATPHSGTKRHESGASQ